MISSKFLANRVLRRTAHRTFLSRAVASLVGTETGRRQRASLSRLDARLLRDIGLTAFDVDAFRR